MNLIGSSNFELLKIQDGGRPPSRKIEKWPYLRNWLFDRHEIWQGDAHWPSEPYRQL